MIEYKIAGKPYEFADTLRVAYELRNVTGANGIQEALNAVRNLGFDGQLDLLYASYKVANKEKAMSRDEFYDFLLDNAGVMIIGDIASKIIDSLVYNGLAPEEAEIKKKQAAEAMKVGAASSAADIE
jgi:hypothetical protein